MLTHEELKELLASRVDEVTLLDVLEITSEELLNAFDDVVERKRPQLLDLVDYSDDEDESE